MRVAKLRNDPRSRGGRGRRAARTRYSGGAVIDVRRRRFGAGRIICAGREVYAERLIKASCDVARDAPSAISFTVRAENLFRPDGAQPGPGGLLPPGDLWRMRALGGPGNARGIYIVTGRGPQFR